VIALPIVAKECDRSIAGPDGILRASLTGGTWTLEAKEGASQSARISWPEPRRNSPTLFAHFATFPDMWWGSRPARSGAGIAVDAFPAGSRSGWTRREVGEGGAVQVAAFLAWGRAVDVASVGGR
jgi:hypothetical protein